MKPPGWTWRGWKRALKRGLRAKDGTVYPGIHLENYHIKLNQEQREAAWAEIAAILAEKG